MNLEGVTLFYESFKFTVLTFPKKNLSVYRGLERKRQSVSRWMSYVRH